MSSSQLHGLLRASHSRNPPRYSHIAQLTLRFYAHIGTGSKYNRLIVQARTTFVLFALIIYLLY